MTEEEVTTVVLDNGAGFIRAGFAGDDAPRSIIRSVVGRPRVPGIMVGLDSSDVYAGQDALDKSGVLKLAQPIQAGRIANWDDMEKVWNHALYTQLKVSPEEHPLCLSEAPLQDNKSREKITEIMFEVFNVPAFYMGLQAVMSLYASGKTTGVVVDSGEGVSHTIPIYEGYAIPHGVQRVKACGSDITKHL